ncbi:hypothetical protein B0H11DRAFT_1903516 [Mycena galericulata]|nr:hypothetical protein B0H11DRAFT_1903516 [Mycena galericulata]
MPASPGAELHLSFYKHTSEHGRHSASVGRIWRRRGGGGGRGGRGGGARGGRGGGARGGTGVRRPAAREHDEEAALEAGDYWPRRRPSPFHPPVQARIAPRDDEGVQIVAQAVSASPSSDFGAQFVTGGAISQRVRRFQHRPAARWGWAVCVSGRMEGNWDVAHGAARLG